MDCVELDSLTSGLLLGSGFNIRFPERGSVSSDKDAISRPAICWGIVTVTLSLVNTIEPSAFLVSFTELLVMLVLLLTSLASLASSAFSLLLATDSLVSVVSLVFLFNSSVLFTSFVGLTVLSSTSTSICTSSSFSAVWSLDKLFIDDAETSPSATVPTDVLPPSFGIISITTSVISIRSCESSSHVSNTSMPLASSTVTSCTSGESSTPFALSRSSRTTSSPSE
ncbi:hypothetical protein AGLY_011203 [Aphis glycines]|uniref:Uncharacterized protein n=1 Tax=Aphis glycines TaxID=307491 RepID=A0A6G0TEX4_APHGL|nr:hypothetical protein AGLY_011203 [Aphis glycines]